jgi:hypothetical protein
VSAQTAADGPVLRGRSLAATAPVKMFIPSGTVRIAGWDRESLVVRGHLAKHSTLVMGGSDVSGIKLAVEARGSEAPGPSNLVIYVPRRSQVSIKGADLNLSVTDLPGSFYTVSGAIQVRGTVSSVDAESMTGSIDLNVTTPWARVKTGQGNLLIRGAPQDVDASTIGGTLDIASSDVLRGRFASVTGDIRYAATPAPRSLFEFSSHSGMVDLLLLRDVSARLELSSVEGEIANGFTQVRPSSVTPHALRMRLGNGDAQIAVRTFRGTVRLRPR